MTVIRELRNHDNSTNYIASLGLVCCVSTLVLMLRFLGFKASLNFGSAKSRSDTLEYPIASNSIIGGTYKSNREDLYGYESLSKTSKKITPSMVLLPPNQSENNQNNVKTAKSTSDITQAPLDIPVHLRKSTPNVSLDPKGGTSNNRNSTDLYRNKEPSKDEKKILERKQKAAAQNDIKQQKLLEKEQKKKKKLAEKEEKLKKEREDKLRKEREQAKRKKKTKAPPEPTNIPPPPAMPKTNHSNPLALNSTPKIQNAAPKIQKSVPSATAYSSNTLESSISRTTGPPPYDDMPDRLEVLLNTRDSTGNTSFGKRVEESSWDLVSQHRQQMSAPVVGADRRRKQNMVMDLKYNAGMPSSSGQQNNSEV